MKRSTTVVAALCLVVALAASGCGSSAKSSGAPLPSPTTVKARDAGEAIAYDARLSTFATALNASGVLGRLSGSQRVTVFAPDNAAFARLRHATLASLLSRRGKKNLAKLIGAHVVKGVIDPSALHDEKLKTIDGQTITVRQTADGLVVSGSHGHSARVELPPVQAPNAVIYPINGVIVAT